MQYCGVTHLLMCESKCSGVSNTSVREISSTVVLRNYSRGGRGRLEKAGEIDRAIWTRG